MDPAYDDREHSAVKHEIISRYLKAFVPIVGDWAQDIAFLDCMAGPWASSNPDFSDTSFATAVSALRETRRLLAHRGKNPTMRCLFIERDADRFTQLERFASKITDLEVAARNWDFTAHVSDIKKFIRARPNSFPFIFIDPKGWKQIRMETISPIVAIEPCEVLLTLMTSWIVRFLTDNKKGFERILGPDVERLKSMSGDEREEEIVSTFGKYLRQAGNFRFVCAMPILKNAQDAFQYYMVYATRHPKGLEVFKETEKHAIPFMHDARAKAQHRRQMERSGQSFMFGPSETYRESKFSDFRARNLARAKAALLGQLRALASVPYEDAWATSMQFSAVLEEDVRTWLAEWTKSGDLRITNMSHKQRVPQRSKGHQLIWNKTPGVSD